MAVAERRAAAAAALWSGCLAHVVVLRAAVSALHCAEVACLYGVPQAAADLAVADAAEGAGPCRPLASAGVAVVGGLLVRADDVVPAGFDRVAREEIVELVAPGVGVGPLAHGVEHVFLYLDALVADGWVVEGTEDIIDDLVYRDAGVFPSVEDTTGDG